MVCLPKPGKIRANNVVSVLDTRPITVLSCWWRIWSSTWTRSVVRAWMRAHIPQEFAVAHAVSCGEVIVELLDQLSTRGYLMTLDFTKAFDCLDPLVTREVLLHLGWGPSVCRCFHPGVAYSAEMCFLPISHAPGDLVWSFDAAGRPVGPCHHDHLGLAWLASC